MKMQHLWFAALSVLMFALAFGMAGENEEQNKGAPGRKDQEAAKAGNGKKLAEKKKKKGKYGSIVPSVPSPGPVNIYEGLVYAKVKVEGDLDGDTAVVGEVFDNSGTGYGQQVMYPTGSNHEFDAFLSAPSEFPPGVPPGTYPGFRIQVNADFLNDPDGVKNITGLLGVNRSEQPEVAVAEKKTTAASCTSTRIRIDSPTSGHEITVELNGPRGFIDVQVTADGAVEPGTGKVRARAFSLDGSGTFPWGNLIEGGAPGVYTGKIQVPHDKPEGIEFKILAEVDFMNGGKECKENCCYTGVTP